MHLHFLLLPFFLLLALEKLPQSLTGLARHWGVSSAPHSQYSDPRGWLASTTDAPQYPEYRLSSAATLKEVKTGNNQKTAAQSELVYK